MNSVAGLHPVSARTDADGRLIDADPRLMDLIRRAGGTIGQVIAIPEIAALDRLARRLGIAVSRPIVVGDGEDDLELTVRAEPDSVGATLEVAGWRPRPAWRNVVTAEHRDGDFQASEADWVWETDAALRLTHLTLDAGPRFGFDAAAMLGRPLINLFALIHGEGGAFPILGAVAAQMRFDAQDAELRGTGRRVRLSADPRTDARGRFAGFVGAVRMVEAPLAAADERASPFAAGFGARLDRSLRAPLERIVATAQSLSAEIAGPLDPSYTGYADDIASAGRHLLGLVDDLVDLETVEQASFAAAAEPIDLADLARRAAGLLSVRAAERNVRIDRPGLAETLPATGDFRRVLQILVNLTGNAVRYSPVGAMVWVRIERDGAYARVVVADQGRGIAAVDQQRIFTKFGRVDAGEPGGNGLGLYISRRLARAMGGDITLESAAGQGARFVLTLPAR